jgi:hypothetical protein
MPSPYSYYITWSSTTYKMVLHIHNEDQAIKGLKYELANIINGQLVGIYINGQLVGIISGQLVGIISGQY